MHPGGKAAAQGFVERSKERWKRLAAQNGELQAESCSVLCPSQNFTLPGRCVSVQQRQSALS